MNTNLSKSNVQIVKGILSILILVHHLYQYTHIITFKPCSAILQSLGYLSVSIFFFFSGYGLMKGCIKDKELFFKRFLKNNFFPLYIFYMSLVVLYFILYFFLYETANIDTIIRSLWLGYTLVPLGWFFQILFCFYIFFWITSLLENKNKIIFNFIFAFLLVRVCIMLELPMYWYECNYCFVFGIFYSYYENVFRNKLFVKCNLLLCMTICILFILQIFRLFAILPIISKMLSSIVFAIFVILVTWKYSDKIDSLIRYNVIRFVTDNSLGIYSAQGVFLVLSKYFSLNDVSVFLFTVGGTFITCSYMQKFYHKITRIILLVF